MARVAEAVLLAGGIFLAEFADVADADDIGYLIAMIALAVGSVPFCRTLGRRRWIPRPSSPSACTSFATDFAVRPSWNRIRTHGDGAALELSSRRQSVRPEPAGDQSRLWSRAACTAALRPSTPSLR